VAELELLIAAHSTTELYDVATVALPPRGEDSSMIGRSTDGNARSRLSLLTTIRSISRRGGSKRP
jgi:hypothetical protein